MESVEEKKVEEPKKQEEPIEVGTEGVKLEKCLILKSEYRELVSFWKRKHKKGNQRKLTKQETQEVEQRVALFQFDERKFAEYHVEAAIARMMELDAERAQKKFDEARAKLSPEDKGKEDEDEPALEVLAVNHNIMKTAGIVGIVGE